MDFTGKTAIVSGAASGMGLLFSQNFADLGGNVVMADVNGQALEACVAGIHAGHAGKALGLLCDVRDYSQVQAVCRQAADVFGSIDIVVNFAGGSSVRILKVAGELEFPDIPIDVFDWGLDVNLKGQFYFCHAAMKYMRAQQSGLLVNIGSITGEEGDPRGADYATAKSGVMYGLTKSMANYGGKYGVRCVCVSPGPVLTRAAMASMKTAIGRAGEPQEIVDLILFIASGKGTFINGANILIDGGRNALGRAR
ncbi:MAG: SDR family oxidoreductase [Clostridiales bacterium]|jgi:NAD(P)-dependent dehydrogenase (short-subunit alcohol dehydrogenase family)|nr:SDR family oxidoreductase [Clostridiales bacterium]